MLPRNQTREIVVNTADCRFALAGSTLVARRLADEIALAVHIPELEIGALLNFRYPHFLDNASSDRNPWLYADTAIPLLLRRIEAHGVSRTQIRIQAVGGATAQCSSETAEENISAFREVLNDEGLVLEGEDLGGECLRSLWFDPRSGRLLVRTHPAQGIKPESPSHSAFAAADLMVASR
jgi:chemotaxis protein CheD